MTVTLGEQEIVALALSISRGDGRRYVRTPEGSKKYGLPIGALITKDAIKRAAKRFPGMKVPEDDTSGAGSSSSSKPHTAPTSKKTAREIASVLHADAEVNEPKLVTPRGDQKVAVGNAEFNFPSGSKVFRSKKNSDSYAIVRDPNYNLFLVSNNGVASDVKGESENILNERFDDLDDGEDDDFTIETVGHTPADNEADSGDDSDVDYTQYESPEDVPGYLSDQTIASAIQGLKATGMDQGTLDALEVQLHKQNDAIKDQWEEANDPERAAQKKQILAIQEQMAALQAQLDSLKKPKSKTAVSEKKSAASESPEGPSGDASEQDALEEDVQSSKQSGSASKLSDLEEKSRKHPLGTAEGEINGKKVSVRRNRQTDKFEYAATDDSDEPAPVKSREHLLENLGPDAEESPAEDDQEPQRDTSKLTAQEMTDKEISAVLADLAEGEQVFGLSPKGMERRQELLDEQKARKAGKSQQVAAPEPDPVEEQPSSDGALTASTAPYFVKQSEMAGKGIEAGKGTFANIATQKEVLEARPGDKFLLHYDSLDSADFKDSLWGMGEDGQFHLLSDTPYFNESASPLDLADELAHGDNVYVFSGNKDNKTAHLTPESGDIATEQWLSDSPEGSTVQSGDGLIGEKNADGSFDTAMGTVAPDFYAPADVENDDSVVVSPTATGRPAGATKIIKAADLDSVKAGDSLVNGADHKVSMTRRPDGDWDIDADGIHLTMTDSDITSSVTAHEWWHVPNQSAQEEAKADWKVGDKLTGLSDVLSMEPGTKFSYKFKNGDGESTYEFLPNGMVRKEGSPNEYDPVILNTAVLAGRVSVKELPKKDADVPESLTPKVVKNLEDYEVGDVISDYKHLKNMKPGQQVTFTIPSSKNGGQATAVVLTRTDDTKDTTGFMFLVGKKGAGYNSLGENNANIFQAIFDGRLYFGDVTQLPDSPFPATMDGDWDKTPNIDLWEGGPKVSEYDLRTFIDAQVYSRAMQGSYYNTDLLPLDSPFRSQELRKKMSDLAIEKYTTPGVPARHKPAMIRFAAEKLGLQFTDPGAALIPDDLELADFKTKVTIGKQWGKTGVAKDELAKMGAETMEVTKADIKTALAVIDNMLTSNQEEELLKELGLSTTDSTPDKILKRVFAMRGSSLQDLNTSAAVAAYFGYQRYKWDSVNKKWVKSTAIAKQHDKTRNKQLLRQMLLEQLEGREPGYYGMPDDEMYHWVTESGVDKGWYLNRTSMTAPGENAPLPTPGMGKAPAVVSAPNTPEVPRDADDYPLTGHSPSGGQEITPERLFSAHSGEKFELGSSGDDAFTVHMGDDGHLVDDSDGFVYADWNAQSLPKGMKAWKIPGQTYSDPSPVDDGTGIVQVEPSAQPDWFDTIDLSAQILPEDQLGQSGNGFVVIQPTNGGKPFSRWGKFGASGIAVVSSDENGVKRVLVGKRGDRDEWYLPGGAKDEKETAIQGALREFMEEIEEGEDLISQMKLSTVHGTSAGQIVASGPGANSGYWNYTTVVTHIDGTPTVTVKPGSEKWELQNFEWKTLEELEALEQAGQLHKGLSNGNLARMAGMKEGPVEASASSFSFNEPDNLADPAHDITGWTKVGGAQGGSNQGGVYEDEEGNKFYVKKSNGGTDAAHNEVVASALYDALGVFSNKVRLGKRDGDSSTYVVTPWIDNDGKALPTAVQNGDTEFLDKVRADFAIDAWLANYDVIGIGPWNLVGAHDGTPIRIDPGASMMYRATGGKKSWWGNDPIDIDDMRSGNGNSSAYSYLPNVFGSMTDDDVAESAKKLLKISPEQISAIVNASGFDEATKKQLADTLVTRRKKILDRFGIKDTTDNPALDAVGIIQTHSTEGTPKYEVDSSVKLKKTGQAVTVKFSNNEMSWGVGEDGKPIIAMNEEWAHPDEVFESPVGDYAFSNGDRTFSVNEAVQIANPQLGVFAQGKIVDADITSGDVKVVLDGESLEFWTHKDNVAKLPSVAAEKESIDLSKLPDGYPTQPPDGSIILGEWDAIGIFAVEHPNGDIVYYYPDSTPYKVYSTREGGTELKKTILSSSSKWSSVNPSGVKTGGSQAVSENDSTWKSTLSFDAKYVPVAGDKIYTYGNNPFADSFQKAYVVKPSGEVLRVDQIHPTGKVLEGTAAFNVKAQLSGEALHPDYKLVYGAEDAKTASSAPTSLPSGFKQPVSGSKIVAYNKGSNTYVVAHPDGQYHWYFAGGDSMLAGSMVTPEYMESMPNVYDVYDQGPDDSSAPSPEWPSGLGYSPNYTLLSGDEVYVAQVENLTNAAVVVKHTDGTFSVFNDEKLDGYTESPKAVQQWIDGNLLAPVQPTTPASTAPSIPSWLGFDAEFVPQAGDELWMNQLGTTLIVEHPDGTGTYLTAHSPKGEPTSVGTLNAAKTNGLWQKIAPGHELALPQGYAQPPVESTVLAKSYDGIYMVEYADGVIHSHYPSGYEYSGTWTKDGLAADSNWIWLDKDSPQAVVSANTGPKDQFGASLSVGDKIRVAKFNKAGQSPYGVIKSINPTTGKIRVQRTNEHGHPIVQNGKFVYTNHDSSNLRKHEVVSKTQTSEGGLPTGLTVGKGDPSSPLYGTEAPLAPSAPQVAPPPKDSPKLDVSSAKGFLPDSWASRADAAYASYRAKKNLSPVNKAWSDSSTAASLVNGSLMGQGDYLTQIKTKGYFDEDPDLYAEIEQAASQFLKAQSDADVNWAQKSAELKAQYDATIAAYEIQKAAWQVDYAAWVESNGGVYYAPLSPDDPSVLKLSRTQAESWMSDLWEKQKSKLSSSGMSAIAAQKSSSDWQTSSSPLRYLPATLGLDRDSIAAHPDVTAKSMKIWDGIKKAADEVGPIGTAVQVTRGVKYHTLNLPGGEQVKYGDDLTQLIGTVQLDHGAMELQVGSIEKGATNSWYEVTLDVTLPPEIKGVYTGAGGFSYSHESGLVVEGGNALYIWDAKKVHGRWHLRATMIPHDVLPYVNNFSGGNGGQYIAPLSPSSINY